MELTFRGKHVAIPPAVKDYASQKLSRLSRYLPLLAEAVVHVKREGKSSHYTVQVTLNADGRYLRAEERATTIRAAIDAAADSLSRQIRRLKQKKLYRSQRRLDKGVLAPLPNLEEEEKPPADTGAVPGKVVKVKRFAMKPMTEAEAIEQMELLGHSFFLFLDAESGRHSLLYRRRDGHYGLIITEPA